MILLVPSRGRPARAALMAASAVQTADEPVDIRLIVDRDDPYLPEYEGLELIDGLALTVLPERVGYTGSLNAVAREVWDEHDILGAFGDDVLFRTQGWDTIVTEALATPGIAFGNDLVHKDPHPTAIWMSSVIAKALGWLALPASWHLWVDDAWKVLGAELGVLRHLPDLIVEHMHPAVGKAEMDQTYHEVYEGVRGHQDHLGFLDWQASRRGLRADVIKVRRALAHA